MVIAISVQVIVRFGCAVMKSSLYLLFTMCCLQSALCRDEEKIMKSCYWPNEVFEPCFGGCAEVSCDNPRNHLRPCYPYCEAGCVCEEPYVRDDRTHQCVLPQDCSPTQMGIPVPSKRSDKSGVQQKYTPRIQRGHVKREEIPVDFEGDGTPANRAEDNPRRPSEVSRMGNYFNIVIAPPPIKALQPRKLLPSDPFRTSSKRI